MQSNFYNFDRDFKHVNFEVTNLELTDVKDIGDLTSEPQKIIYQYFNDKTEGKRLARKDDINPAELTKFLPFSVVSDILRNDEGEIYDLWFRLLGTAVAEFYGERTGENLSDYVDPQAVERVLTAVKTFCKTRRPLLYVSDHEQVFRKLNIKIFFIPLSSDGEEIDKLFCMFEIG